MKYDSYQGLIFDMDGTLLDTEPTHNKAWIQVLSKYGIHYDPEPMAALNGSPTLYIAQALITQHQSPLDPYRLVAEKEAAVSSIIFDEVRLLPLFDVVKSYYKHRPMAIGTGSLHHTANSLLEHLGVRKYFDVIVGADDVAKHKPEPETFLRCASLLNILPEHCLVFEDADFGIQAAKAAKMDFIDVRHPQL